LKASIARTGCNSNEDILSVSDEPMVMESENIVTMEQETSAILTDVPVRNHVLSTHQDPTTVSLSATVSIPSEEEEAVHDCQGNMCDTEQTTEAQITETVIDITETKLKRTKKQAIKKKGRKNVQKKRNKVPNEITSEGVSNETDGVSYELAESQSMGGTDVYKDVYTDVLNSMTKADAPLEAVDEHRGENNRQDDHSCQNKETVDTISIALIVTEEQYDDVSVPVRHTCHSTTSKNDTPMLIDFQDGSNIALGSECLVMTSPAPLGTIEEDFTKQTDGLETNAVEQQTCETSVTIYVDSIPAGTPDSQTANYNDSLLSPNVHEESSRNSLQSLAPINCGAAQCDTPVQQNVLLNKAAVSQEIDVQSNVTTIELVGQKQKNVRKMKKLRKKKGKGRVKKKNTVGKGVIIPDSTGIQNDCSVGLVECSESVPIAKNTSTEPSVSSTSNRDADICMESSSHYIKSTKHDDEEFIIAKKLKLENDSIASPSNLVTSTSSDNIGNAVNGNACTLLGDDINVSRPSSTTKPDTTASAIDDDNPSISDGKDSSKNTSKGTSRRKYQRPNKRQNTIAVTTAKTVENKKSGSHDDKLENDIEADNLGNRNETNASSSVDTTDTKKEIMQDKSVLESHELQESVREFQNHVIPTHKEPLTTNVAINFEPEINTLTAIPLTENRWA